ncbi:Uncharacterized protein LOCC1_G003205 [Lachnellula occidentalis]|uniref:DNL-type domain-containing protein n=1 Tax=Lachnellula occidentalis TaxID=215460 RepID=A0A8H8S650_9HELO|nr:Uncharacterized protein LOCC1_G003205 [Lachnellula occidentalis]
MPPKHTTLLSAFRSLSKTPRSLPLPLRRQPLSPQRPRLFHTTPFRLQEPSKPLTDTPLQPNNQTTVPPPPSQPKPEYQLSFTCTPCGTRSAHRVSKQGYHHGSVLITCPDCRNRHVISDHLNIFGDRKMTIEDLMKDKGQLVKKGTLSEDGDMEFWEDGTQTEHKKDAGGKETKQAVIGMGRRCKDMEGFDRVGKERVLYWCGRRFIMNDNGDGFCKMGEMLEISGITRRYDGIIL